MRPALFLDRDGVIVRDVDRVLEASALEILDGVPAAIARARGAGLAIVVVTNQPIVARGLVDAATIRAIHAELQRMLGVSAHVDAFYFCPHHPNATLEQYRATCACRKPRPGMLQTAASELGLDLAASAMVGDRLSDVTAGARAGCGRTILVETGKHLDPAIESPDGAPPAVPTHVARDLSAAVDWLLR